MQSDRPLSRAVPVRTALRLMPAALATLTVLSALAVPLSGAAQGPQPATLATAVAPPRAVTARPAPARPDTRPAWAELNKDQQAALRPLASSWNSLSEAQKRKWQALSANFRQMGPDEQAKLHSRMNDWVALSPQQRTQARLNFAETKNLSPDDKKAKWEAYQALPADEKRKFATGTGAARTPQTAAALRPVSPQKLATLPPRARSEGKAPRIAAGPPPHVAPGAPQSHTN